MLDNNLMLDWYKTDTFNIDQATLTANLTLSKKHQSVPTKINHCPP